MAKGPIKGAKVDFNGTEYPLRHLDYFSQISDETFSICVSTLALNDALVSFNGGYASKKAQALDEAIFFYINEEEMSLPDNALLKTLRQNTELP
jgi:hypothetical protein